MSHSSFPCFLFPAPRTDRRGFLKLAYSPHQIVQKLHGAIKEKFSYQMTHLDLLPFPADSQQVGIAVLDD